MILPSGFMTNINISEYENHVRDTFHNVFLAKLNNLDKIISKENNKEIRDFLLNAKQILENILNDFEI